MSKVDEQTDNEVFVDPSSVVVVPVVDLSEAPLAMRVLIITC